MSSGPLPLEPHPTGFKDNVIRCLRKYVDATGRARRREFWWFTLFQIGVIVAPIGIMLVIDQAVFTGANEGAFDSVFGLFSLVFILAYLGLIIPSITVMIRRFHDVGLTGWLILLNLLPFGGLFSLIVCLIPSQSKPTKHGPVPAGPAQYAETFR